MKFKNRPNQCIKDEKGNEHWISRSVALVGVIAALHKDKTYVLVGLRGPGAPDFQSHWNVPCGYLDWDENGYEGLCREVFEETNINIPEIIEKNRVISDQTKQPFYVNTNIKENRQNVSLSFGLYFECDKLPYFSNVNCEPGEVSGLMWMNVKNLTDYKFAFKHDERILYYFNSLKQNKYAIKM